jgi:hypothetical protein
MKTVFLFFAALNVIFFLWQYSTMGAMIHGGSVKKLVQDKSVPTLVLLGEPKAGGKSNGKNDHKKNTQTAMVESHPGKPAAAKKNYIACYTFGPFEEYLQLKSVTNQLRALDADVIQRKETKQEVLGHWVYLPSFPDWDAAHKKVTELEDKGIKDIFILGRGDLKNAVSLGLFKNEDGAKRRVARLRKLGVKPKVDVQETSKELVWLDINIDSEKEKVETTLKSFNVVNKALKVRNRKCK